MADGDTCLLKEDGYLYVKAECKSIIYHPNLNVLLITTASGQVYVFDVNFGVILQRSSLSGKSDGKLQGVYLAEGVDKVLYTDGRGIGVRSDYNGVLLLDTILQTPVARGEDIIKMEILLSEAILLNQCLRLVSVPGVEHVKEVLQELSNQIHIAQGMQKKGVKAQKVGGTYEEWNTICLELPHAALKLVCSGLVAELKKQNKHIPALPIASAINERLNGLLRGLTFEGGPADRALMFSEAARRETFSTWPHMNYKWALPGQMAQAGFYHEPNPTANDRAMCFTCNVCLVCWEPTDEPWSEHERHLPTCPFVKGEHTQNVPLSVTLATAPARESSEPVDVIGTTNVPGLVATASHKGLVTVWNISNQLKSEVSFCVASRSQEANNKESIQFFAARNLTSAFLSNLSGESDPLVEYEAPTSQTVKLTALSLVRGPKSQVDEEKTSAGSANVQSTTITPETSESKIRPCLVCGLTLETSNPSNLRTLENVWAASTDLAPSSSLVRAMNSVNSAASDSLDIMKVAGDRSNIVKNHYLVLYDFHHKAPSPQTSKEDSASKAGKTKKTVSGTGTTASSNGGRQESLYQDMYMSKFLYEVPVIEDVDCEMVGGTHFDGIFQTATLPTSSTNSLYHSTSFGMPQSPFDANFNPINATEQFPSTSDISAMNKKTTDRTKSTKNDLVVLQSVCIEAPPELRISYVGATKDGRHLFVSLVTDDDRASDNTAGATTTTTTTTATTTTNANQMDVDEESEIFSSKSLERMYWDQNGASLDAKLINGEINNEEKEEEEEVAAAATAATAIASRAILLAYALDFSGKVVKLVPEPVVRRDLPASQAPLEHVFLPLQEKHRATNGCDETAGVPQEPKGRVCLVCKDGVVRILNLATLKTLTEARPHERTVKYVSAAYCNGLERLCVCSSDGDLNFFRTSEEDDLIEEKDDSDDVNMITEAASFIAGAAAEVAGTSSSSAAYQEPILAHRPNLTNDDLRDIYELTRFDRHSPAYGATVPSCWNEMMQAQRQRRHPQHLHQSENQHHTRTWRLQNDMTTWDEHIFELTLPRSAAGCVGHVDVRFILHWPCLEIPIIQVTLLKQKMAGLGHHKSPLTPVDDRIDFSLEDEENGENPVISEEYQRQHNTEILCGPINLQRCTDLSDHSGCVTLTSPKLFSTKARTLLVHIKALADPVKDSVTPKSKVNLLETKPPILKKLRIDEAGPLLPGATVERLAAGANKKLEAYIGCDWIHELSITVRSVQPTNIPNERLQRCAMLESTLFIENLLKVACLQGADKTLVAQSLALDILIWVVAIRLTRLRVGQNTTETKAMQLDTVRCIQGRLNPLLRTCLLHAGRSVAHKCVKLIILCSEGLHNTDDPAPHSFDEAVLAVLVALLPSIVSVQWAGSLRWLALLITRLLPLDRNHAIAQQCVAIVQQISAEMSNRVNPYHLLLATRFGLYNTPFETELFDIEPPMPPKSSSMPVTYATILTGEQSSTSAGTTTSNAGTQDMIDLRDLLTLPAYSSGELVVPSKLKSLCTNHSMKGLLEVEPLHFTCHAASDGTKMEKIDSGANTGNMGTTLFDTGVTTNNVISEFKTVQHTAYNLDAGSLLPDLQAKLKGKLSDLLSQCTAELAKKPAAQLSITPDDQSDSDELNNMTGDNQIWHGEQNDTSNSHALASAVTKEKSTIANIGAGAHKVEDNSVKKREDVSFPWGRLLCWPPQQALVVERMHSGARRFVVLDFGSPILLTDLMIPSCSDLVSLSIDIWTKNEEIDGTRLVVAGDIGTKPLVVNDLQPPPVCRYLKITTIGRYGMSTTRCRIPLGMFYGHMVGLPGEDYSEPHGTQTTTIGNSESTLQATIDTQCSILSALAEDVQCRFSLATERLKTLLDPLLCTETPNVMHMQHYLNRSKSHAENKEQPSTKILSTYQECILFQHQLNVVRGVWRRLESWRGCKVVPSVSLASASSDKLRVLGETLLDILLYTVYEIGPVPSLPASLCDVFTPSICEAFFHSVCVVTPAPRLQLHAAAFLARMAGHQPWWGNFLANTLVNLYSTSSTCIFPQDRVFILLTFLGRKSLIAGANKSSVVDAMVRTLGRLLAPISNDQTSSASNSLDTTLIGWVLLFLSVCLDTTAQQLPCLEDNSEKSKEQGVASRWEFLQGESAMQRKYVSASRYSASRSYRRKLQKRLMHHKQQLQDLEQAKKVFQTSSQAQAWGSMPAQVSTLSNKLEAALKSQERFFKKTLRQHTSKHFKDIISIRRNEVHLPRGNRSHPQSSSSRPESLEIDVDCMANLSHQHVLPVARGLVALILNNAANVDMFLLACKVVARLVVSTRPAISLGELMTEEQLVRLVKLATGISDSAWSSHAVACLLQDLLEGGRLFPRPYQGQDGNQSEEVFEPLGAEGGRMGDDDLVAMAGTSGGASTALGNDEGFAEGDGDEDTQDSIVPPQATPSTSKSNGFNLPSVVESDDSELEDFLDDILERGKNTLKKGTVSKLPTAATSGSISLAIDARLEYGIETGVEISLRRLSTLGVYNLPLSINATVQIPADVNRSAQPSPRNSAWLERNQEMWSVQDTPSSLSMLTRCFDKIFTDLLLQQNSSTSLELVLQLWLSLNLDASLEQSSSTTQFDPSLTPVIPLSSAAISGLISALLWHPGVSLRAWCLALQTLTLASNEPLPSDHVDPSISTPLDGLLGGMASCVVKDRNIGPMFLRLLSGNGLNVESRDKQYMMAGPRVALALQDFLVRLETRCDVILPGSSLGNALKKLLLWVVYQLVQPGGALVARRGPLDAQCILITSLISLSFTNTDLGTAMSISECVGVLVSTYIRGARGAECGGIADSSNQTGNFGGLFSCVLGGGSKQGRPTSWETLVVALIKLVCRLVQTPLANARLPPSGDSIVDMELGEACQRPGTSSDDQAKLNISQTDESKVAEQQTSMRQQQTTAPRPRYPCVADTVLQHEPTMMRLLGALGYSAGFCFTMLFDGDEPELRDPASIPDATFELLSTLMKKATRPQLVLNPLYRYLASSCGQSDPDRQMGIMQLSEPLLWYILKVLDNEESVGIFTAMGGVKVLCENLVNNGSMSSGLSSPGVIALVMQHLSNAPNLAANASSSGKKTINSLESGKDNLLNFAPLGTVSWVKPMVEPADVLVQSSAPHRRARTAAWSYQFFPGEFWVDLTITLPCAILLKEVELQPHLSSLATCPSAVALEISREGNSDLTPVCPPMPTAGLTAIHLTLSQPEVATSVLVRLYKPRDCTNISLSQIKILGTTAFGEIKSHNETIAEEQLTKTSFGWLRLVHQCLSVSNLSSNLAHDVLTSAAGVEGLIEACCSLLLLRPRSLYTPDLERVLLQLGLHSRELGLQLINLLLNNRCTPLFHGTSTSRKSSTAQLVVELLQQLCLAQDSNTEARVSAVLSWLRTSAESALTRPSNTPNVVCPPAVYVHCVASIVWKAHEHRELSYNLESLLPDELFNSLYEWTLTLRMHSALKLAIDAALCSLCYVRPALFPLLLQKVRILVPNLATDRSASISDDRKDSEGQTDDRKSETDAEEWYCRLVLPEHKRLELTEGQLLTVAAAAKSPTGIQQLIDSGLPSMLSATITEFCELEKSKQYGGTALDDDRIPSTSNTSMTDSDKAGEAANHTRNNTGGLCMTEPDSIAVVLEFLSLICSEGRMRDWLGKEGRDFWLPLVSLLSNRPIENPSVPALRMNVAYSSLESAMIKFLSRCCWCHPNNQKLLSELLTNVILQQRTSPNVRYLHGISGFTRRLILQLLLEGEKVLVSVTSETPMTAANSTLSHNTPSMPPHPADPHGHYHHLLYMSTQSTVADVLQQVSGTWLLLRLSNSGKGSDTSASGTPSGRRDAWETGTALMADTLSVAAGNTAKDKRAKEASNRSQARGPTLRKARLNLDATPSTSKSPNSAQPNSGNSGNQQYLTHSSPPNLPLPPQLTIAQLLAIAEDNGASLSDPILHLTLKEHNKDSKEEAPKLNDSELSNYRHIEGALGVFSAAGGLAVLAKHLPLVYPESGRPTPLMEKSPSPEQPDADWVKVEVSDDTYVDLVEAGISNSPRATPPAPHVPFHSLAAFGLFLRLPGYAEVLLGDRKQAQCLLRLALGVTDDGEGGDILSSPIASSLPTLPFQVLKQLLESTPPTTDDGLLLRRTTIEVGAVLLLLNCLAIFTHQTGHNEGTDQRGVGQTGGRSDDKSHLYWAKGTGFGTGSTQQSWNVEQALSRQRSEEEHVTVLLQVLASYVGSGGQPQRDLPVPFTDLLARSCLLPALSSYLRNDSVLDMARHIPLYRAILQLLRAMALSSQLAPLLMPRGGRPNDASIVSLLYTMRMCVDAYVYKINRSRGNKSRTPVTKYPEDTEQDEGLATLIPDIQESATIVQNATSRLNVIGEELAGPSPTGPELPLRSVEQRYLEVMKKLQFDTFEIIADNTEGSGYKFAVSYHFESNMRTAGERNHPARVKRLAQEAVTLSHALPLSYSSSVFVRCDAERLDIMKVLITGPAETPYANGCFEFDVYFPPDYPNSPMMINLETTGRQSVRFNPNLYNDGKVCLSVLNTWHGRPEEKWNAHTSSFLQVLVSIQSLILVPEPYFNEPGYERSRGTPLGAQSSQEYNANICQATVKWAMLDQIKNPCPCFKEVIHTHFWIKRHEIIAQLQAWIMEMELHGSDRRCSRISINAFALRRYFRLLREELNKLPTPEGLEDLAEPLASPGSPLEFSAIPDTPNSPPSSGGLSSSTTMVTSSGNPSSSNNALVVQPSSNPSAASNHVHHDIDTDVEMEKMVSKVCE